MDQRLVGGVGNIYANERICRARIHPARGARSLGAAEAVRLREEIVGGLSGSIALRGTSFRDYVDASGGRGGFVERLGAYGRAGLPCKRCGAELQGTHEIDGRSTVFCATCQQ